MGRAQKSWCAVCLRKLPSSSSQLFSRAPLRSQPLRSPPRLASLLSPALADGHVSMCKPLPLPSANPPPPTHRPSSRVAAGLFAASAAAAAPSLRRLRALRRSQLSPVLVSFQQGHTPTPKPQTPNPSNQTSKPQIAKPSAPPSETCYQRCTDPKSAMAEASL